jgi:hypothetical protein
VLDDRQVEPAGAEPGQVGDGGAGARQDEQVGVGDIARRGREDDIERGLEAERVEVREVADPGQPDDRRPVIRSITVRPGASRPRSPRNLLTTKPVTRA